MKSRSFFFLLASFIVVSGCSILFGSQSQEPAPASVHETAETKTFRVQNLSNIVFTEVHDTTFAVWVESTNTVLIFNSSGDLIYKTKTDNYYSHNVKAVYEDRLSLRIDGKNVLIDSHGNVVKHDAPNLKTQFLDGLAIADWGWSDLHFYDRSGNIVNQDLKVDNEIYPIRDGKRLFHQLYGKYGFVDENAEVCIQPTFPSAHSFSEGLAVACEYRGSELLWGYIDLDGNWAIEPTFTHEPGDFHDGYAVARKKNGRYVYINKKGEVCSGEYYSAESFCDGKARVHYLESVQYGDRWYNCAIIDTSFNRFSFIVSATYDSEFCETTKTYHRWDGRIHSSDWKCVFVPSSSYSAGAFYHDLAKYYIGTRPKGYVNMKGEIVLKFVENEL